MRDRSRIRRGERVQREPLPPTGSESDDYAASWRDAAVERARDAFDSGADYLREHDLDEIRTELEGRVRERPLASLAIAAVAGFMIARILRH
jgi:ElaB/YqjD/DUF883 family membrane-anchored ribosome-binding protein